jgi:MFS transporter, DHA1 family, purine base/nucleoside efflux pump
LSGSQTELSGSEALLSGSQTELSGSDAELSGSQTELSRSGALYLVTDWIIRFRNEINWMKKFHLFPPNPILIIHMYQLMGGELYEMGAREKRSLFVGWITLFLMGTDLFVVSPLLPFISHAHEVSTAAAGWMVSVFAVTFAFSTPFFGWLSDKSGRKGLITFGLLLFAFSNALTAFASTFTLLILSRILAGLAVASITPLIYAIIGDIAPANRRGTWLSIIISGHLTALWTGAPIGALLEQLLGWQSVFIVMACLGLVLAVVNFRTWGIVSKPRTNNVIINGNLSKIIFSVITTTIWAISMYSLYVYLGAALYSVNNFTVSEIALSVTFYGVGAVMGGLISGRLTDRFGEKRISLTTPLLLSMILVGLGLFFTAGIWIYIFLLLWALVGYAGFASYQARLAVEFPAERGMVMAWNHTALYTGISLGSIVGGLIISEWGYAALPFASGGIALISFLLILRR